MISTRKKLAGDAAIAVGQILANVHSGKLNIIAKGRGTR